MNSYDLISPGNPFKHFDVTNMTYLDFLIDVIQKTDQENWNQFSESKEVLAKDFLKSGELSRVIVSCEKSENRSKCVVAPVGYIQLEVMKKNAVSLFVNDTYHNLNIPSENLFLDSKEIGEDTPLYINVVAVKKYFQGDVKILFKMCEALVEIIESIPNRPKKMYAVAVTNEGRRMCQFLEGDCINPISSTERVTKLNGEIISHERTLYGYTTNEVIEKIRKVIFRSDKKASHR